VSSEPVPWFIVANLTSLCHKRNFIARLIKGCRVDARAGCFISEIIKHFQRSNEHFSRKSAPLGAFFCGNRRAKCPSLRPSQALKSASR
jgi:hypothetical protein